MRPSRLDSNGRLAFVSLGCRQVELQGCGLDWKSLKSNGLEGRNQAQVGDNRLSKGLNREGYLGFVSHL